MPLLLGLGNLVGPGMDEGVTVRKESRYEFDLVYDVDVTERGPTTKRLRCVKLAASSFILSKGIDHEKLSAANDTQFRCSPVSGYKPPLAGVPEAGRPRRNRALCQRT